jgi:short-subunit dehydrogenase
LKRVLPNRPRVVLTGAAGGLGRAFLAELAPRQPRVLLIDRDAARLAETVAEVEAAGGEAVAQLGDVTDAKTFELAAQTMQERFSGTDLLINNAGVAAAGSIGEAPLSDWDWVLRINLFGMINGCHVFTPIMKKQGSGAILNVSSSAAIASLPTMGAYNVSKAGVVALSETLSAEVRELGISVSVLCPTFFRTNLLETFRAPSEQERKLAQAAFDHSTMSAGRVAKIAIAGLEAGELIVIPQPDGRLVWRAKRYWPNVYYWVNGSKKIRGFAERMLLK